MEDGYWRYNNDPRQQPPSSVPSLPPKRPRSDYEAPSGREMAGYYSRDDGKASQHQPPYAVPDSGRLPGSGMPGHPVDDPRMGGDPRMVSDPFIASDPRLGIDPRMASVGVLDPAISMNGCGSGRPEVSLPPDASNTIFVEGLPANCTRREVAHIFHPFVGYKEVRLVTKEPRHRGRDPLVLCFVDFVNPAHAATAMDALQGYNFDENDRDSTRLRLQFARYPGARSGGGHGGRGRR